jgi:hypothetical protein
MSPIDIPAIEQQARRLRAEEIQHVQGLVSQRMGLYGKLLRASAVAGLMALGEVLRRLFSWNPRAQAYPTTVIVAAPGKSVLERLDRVARSLFSWNPRAGQTY